MNWKRKAVLVTGGASFIGSHLVENLVDQGAEVAVADDLSSGRKENLAAVKNSVSLRVGDLRNRDFAHSVIRDADIVFHLAASHGGRGYIATHPAQCSSNMVLDGTVFEASQVEGVEKVCLASSACVYPTVLQRKSGNGRNRSMYLKEDMASPFEFGKAFADEEYGWAKLMGEMALGAYHKQFGLKGASCRIFTAYGPRENESHAVIALIAKAFVKQDPYEIWGTGQQDRNFTFVSDIAEGLVRAAERIEDCSPVNLGTSEHIRILDVARRIFSITGHSPSRIFKNTDMPEGVFSRSADLSRSRRILDWEPKTSFDDGLRQTIDWYYSTHQVRTVQGNLSKLLRER